MDSEQQVHVGHQWERVQPPSLLSHDNQDGFWMVPDGTNAADWMVEWVYFSHIVS